MDLIIGLLTIVLVLNCVFLVLLILVQLPKKDAGAGVAFGGGTTDALFGSGTGTVLTKATRYATTVFLVLAMGLSVLQSHQAKASRQGVLDELETRAASAPAAPVPTLPPPTVVTNPPVVDTNTAVEITGTNLNTEVMGTNPVPSDVETPAETAPEGVGAEDTAPAEPAVPGGGTNASPAETP